MHANVLPYSARKHNKANAEFFIAIYFVVAKRKYGAKVLHAGPSGTSPSSLWLSSSVVTSYFGSRSGDDSISNHPSLIIINESWNQCETKFLPNNTNLFEKLQKSSVYGSTDDDNRASDGWFLCDVDYWRDSVQVT